ncbi:MAG: DUF4293 family protein [Flavobacteriales bacterium]
MKEKLKFILSWCAEGAPLSKERLFITFIKIFFMIQRIQSLYLLGAGLIGVYIAYPFFRIPFIILENNVLSIGIAFFYALVLLLTFFTIFKFNNRKLQIKLSTILLALSVVGGILYLLLDQILMYHINSNRDYVPSAWNLDSGYLSSIIHFAVPLTQIILIFLALRAIKKDEELVRSTDRLR